MGKMGSECVESYALISIVGIVHLAKNVSLIIIVLFATSLDTDRITAGKPTGLVGNSTEVTMDMEVKITKNAGINMKEIITTTIQEGNWTSEWLIIKLML